ncbi:energy transducer TonB [uncultured Umboniibacter sp.]|uniref:TonB family protein n=1 Tax=uncultured Umboniibacter sp. TaxID=1798917 RepID=UPI00260445EE|nr:energy transducer TonB [uncultured Umboniibacter sp.]
MLGRTSDRWASIVFAVGLHALIALFLGWGWTQSIDYQISQPIKQITATLVNTPQPQAEPERAIQPSSQPTRQPQPQESRPAPVTSTPAVIEEPVEEAEVEPVPEVVRTQPQRRQPLVDELSFDSLLEQEDEVRQAESEAEIEMSQIQVLDAKFQLQVGAKWSRPPSARNGMEVLVRVQFLPNGEVLAATVVESSGDVAFDRSAISAIEQGAPYSFLMDFGAPFFNKNYRNKLALFRPEDLK